MQPEGVALDLILESNKYTMHSTDLHNTIQYKTPWGNCSVAQTCTTKYLKMLKRYNYAPLTYTNAYFSAEKVIRIQWKTQEMVWLVDSSMIGCETIQKHRFYDFVYNKT